MLGHFNGLLNGWCKGIVGVFNHAFIIGDRCLSVCRTERWEVYMLLIGMGQTGASMR